MSRFRIVFFLGVVSLILYAANLVVYEALAAIFAIDAKWQLMLLGVALGTLSASFILSTLAGMRYYNIFTRLLYRISAVWLGSLVYLFLAAALYALLMEIPGVPPLAGAALMAVAVLVSAYGVVHARTITTKEITVRLQHLPAIWEVIEDTLDERLALGTGIRSIFCA